MGPQLLLDTSHLMKHVDALGNDIESNFHRPTIASVPREIVEFVQRQNGQLIDLGIALGCAAFSMGVVIGVYVLLHGV